MRALVFHWRAIDSNAVDEQKTQTPSNAIRFCSLNFPMTFSHYSKNKCCEPSPSDHTVCVSSFGFWGLVLVLVLLFLSNGGIMVWPFFLSKRKFSEQWIRARWLLGTFFSCFSSFSNNEKWKFTLEIRRPVWQFVSSFVFYWLNATQNFWAFFLFGCCVRFSCFSSSFLHFSIHFGLVVGRWNQPKTKKKRFPKRWAEQEKKSCVCDVKKFMSVRVLQSVVRCFFFFFFFTVVSHFQRISNSSSSSHIHFASHSHSCLLSSFLSSHSHSSCLYVSRFHLVASFSKTSAIRFI